MITDIEEKKELIVESYKKSYNISMAYDKVGLSDDERDLIDSDLEFQQRIRVLLISEQETVTQNFRSFMDSEDEGVRLKATMGWAQVIHPELFKPTESPHKPDSESEGDFDEINSIKAILKTMSKEDFLHALDQANLLPKEIEH